MRLVFFRKRLFDCYSEVATTELNAKYHSFRNEFEYLFEIWLRMFHSNFKHRNFFAERPMEIGWEEMKQDNSCDKIERHKGKRRRGVNKMRKREGRWGRERLKLVWKVAAVPFSQCRLLPNARYPIFWNKSLLGLSMNPLRSWAT